MHSGPLDTSFIESDTLVGAPFPGALFACTYFKIITAKHGFSIRIGVSDHSPPQHGGPTLVEDRSPTGLQVFENSGPYQKHLTNQEVCLQ